VLIRDATAGDLAAIVDIYNDVIAHTTAVWRDQLVTLEERRGWLARQAERRYPVLVAVDGDGVVGFASLGDFRPLPGYRPTAEVSIYVTRQRRGLGTGRLLLGELVERGRRIGKAVLVAAIEASNTASLALHRDAGFREAGILPAVGEKFGRRLDLALLYRDLEGEVEPPVEPLQTVERVGPVLLREALAGSLVRLEPLARRHAAGLWEAAAEMPPLEFAFVPRTRSAFDHSLETAEDRRSRGEAIPLVVVRRHDGRVVGTTSFLEPTPWRWPPDHPQRRSDGLPDSVEIGATWLVPSVWRSGVNADAKLLMLTHAFEVWGVRRVQLCTDVRNLRSRGAIEALGATFEGIRRSDRPGADGTVRDSAHYAITAGDWPEVRAGLRQRLARRPAGPPVGD